MGVQAAAIQKSAAGSLTPCIDGSLHTIAVCNLYNILGAAGSAVGMMFAAVVNVCMCNTVQLDMIGVATFFVVL